MTLKHELEAIPDVWDRIRELRRRSLDLLAPQFRAGVDRALIECHRQSVVILFPDGESDTLPLDVRVHETLRTDALQRIYFAQGTTNARSARWSWHHYGLAVDVVSTTFGWFTGAPARDHWPDDGERSLVCDRWFSEVARVFQLHGCDWGGHWSRPDLPHMQWHLCAPSPDRAPAIYDRAGGGGTGRRAVWRAVGAA